MRIYFLHIWPCLLFLLHLILVQGKGPILIKSDGKKKHGKELIMLNGCSPMLIRGSDKKSKNQQMIIAGGGDCGRGHVQIIPQYVPIPYYVHKPHYIHVPKYIHKHHYIRVPHIIVKKVPVPIHIPQYVPVPYEKKEIHLMYHNRSPYQNVYKYG
ncbi:hypothetical protein BLOT_016022 [Blomia tropicalis]|nr:hypothetical protein BLOT_016022 [Blomia tropicalis]